MKRKRTRKYKNGEETKQSVFAGDMITYIEKPNYLQINY